VFHVTNIVMDVLGLINQTVRNAKMSFTGCLIIVVTACLTLNTNMNRV